MTPGLYNFLINITLIVSVIVSFIATTKTTDTLLRKWLAIGALMGSIHFWLANIPISCLITSIFGLQQLALIRLEGKIAKIRLTAFIIFELLYTWISIHEWKGLTSIISLSTLLITTYGFFYLTGQALRQKMYVIWGLILINIWVIMDIKQATIATIALIINIMILKKLKHKLRKKIKQKSLSPKNNV